MCFVDLEKAVSIILWKLLELMMRMKAIAEILFRALTCLLNGASTSIMEYSVLPD